MHFAHLFNFVKIDNEASLVVMIFLDTLTTKHCQMVRAVEVLDSLLVFLAQQTVDAHFVFEIYVS
jgi:hypothetical protein